MEEQNTKREQEIDSSVPTGSVQSTTNQTRLIAEGDNNSIKSNSSNRPQKLPNPKRMMSLNDQTNIGSAMQLDKPVQKSILKKSFGSQAQITESTADIHFLDNMKSSIAAMKSSFGVSQSSDPNAQSDNQHRSYRKDKKLSLENVKEDTDRLPLKVQLRQKEPIPEKPESLDYMTSNLQASPDSIRKEAKPAELQIKPLERIAHSKVLIPLSPISTESTSLKPYNRLSVAQSPTTHSPLSSEPCSPSIKDNASAQSLGIGDFSVVKMQNEKLEKKYSSSRKSTLDTEQRGYAKEVVETVPFKIWSIRYPLLSILMNSLLLVFIETCYSKDGAFIPFGKGLLYNASPVWLLFWMFLNHLVTSYALDSGLSILIGFMMTGRKGYSIAIYGFYQANAFEKTSYVDKLSIKSILRKPLTILSYIWVLYLLAIILIPLTTIQMYSYNIYEKGEWVSCTVYIDDDNSYDRGYPTANNQFGVAEVLFGTVLGTLRSEEAVDFTSFVMSPQLMDPVVDSSTIIGAGYSANISTVCSCSPGITASDFEKWGLDTAAAVLLSDSVSSSPAFSLVTYLNRTEDKIGLSNVLTVRKVCGGSQSNSAIFYPTCYTEITDFRHANVLAAYMTDGTPASISIKSSDVVESLEPANMSKLYNALNYMYGGKITSQILPSTFPSAINPLIWWTTTNTQTISPPLLSAGIETLHSILLRSSIQRYFSIKGTKCESRVISENSVTLRIGPSGHIFGLIFAGTDIFLAVLSIAMTAPWLFSKRLISPAVRIATNRLYFQLMVCSNPTLYGGFVTSFDMLDFWVKLDLMGKVGESKDTIDDEEYGKIALNKPKLVRPFQTGKLYN